ncbi:NUDIX domain-containing protein [Streptomyces sp. SID5785]|uniref:NUDIX hydrolase n=1 Tax=Streptomyces sp. SID5785 TaxID=2690309 RepID=UPI0013611625|nr:NUDIX domain-containing protein [Streptomyces sp. SID5785]MZD07170.1 NUDIX domain-containing protein [Streptomyces sp. SID5785]
MGELVERVDEHDQVLEVVDRSEAIRQGWLHRITTIVCRDEDGRFLVHRRPADDSRFPGQYNWMLGGAADVGESYEEAAARELEEELGVHAAPKFLFKFLCSGAISPYWLGLHEAVITVPVRPSDQEVAWHDWLSETDLEALAQRQEFVPDAREAFDRYRNLNRTGPPQS